MIRLEYQAMIAPGIEYFEHLCEARERGGHHRLIGGGSLVALQGQLM
jgi:hypothetical protein